MADAKHMAKPGQRVNSGHEDTRTDIGKRGWKKLAISVVAWFIAVLATAGLLLVGPLPFSDNPILGAAAARFAASLVLIVVLILLGGRSWLRITGSGLVYTFKRAWMLLLIGIVPAGISYFKAATGNGFPADFLPNLGFVALLCIGIGMLEEGLFRGIELNGLLAGLGGWRWGVLAAVFISSIMFGTAHVSQEGITSGAASVQAILKVVQSAMFGIVLCETCMHSRELGSAVIFHALNDFIMLSVSMGLQGTTTASSYVCTDQSTQVMIAYGLMIAVSLWPTIQALRALWSEQRVNRGAFME